MGRDPRYVPPNSLQHVVDMVFQGRYLFRPSPELNDRLLGVLGRAQRRFDMPICAVVVMSNHYHLLLSPADAEHLARFMCFVKTNLAKEVGGRLRQWSGYFFDGRYQTTHISDEEIAQAGALRYVLAQGVKENLVDTVRDWPGVHSAAATVEGKAMVGTWIDRTAERAARRRGRSGGEERVRSEESVNLSPIPSWAHLAEKKWRQNAAELVELIDRDAAVERASAGIRTLGIKRVLTADPLRRPETRKRSPKRRFQAVDREVLQGLIEAWSAVLAAYREAASRQKLGQKDVQFPPGTFPPALPFVPFPPPNSPDTSRARGQPC